MNEVDDGGPGRFHLGTEQYFRVEETNNCR